MKPMTKKQKMTLEKLARMMQGEFLSLTAGINKRFDGVDKRFDGVDKRLDGIDKRLTKLESDVLEIRMDLDNIKLRLDNEKVYRFEIRNLERRLSRLEAKLGVK